MVNRQFVLLVNFKFTVDQTLFVIPERFELSTPDLKDRYSNHLSYEIICNLNSK